MTKTLYASALGYIGRGWAVFPVSPRGKMPAIASAHPKGDPQRGVCQGECGRDGHGLHDATLDAERISAWWAKMPRANIGLRTGLIFDVLDVDADHGGWKSLAELAALHGGLPGGPVSATGGGGAHYLFTATGLTNTVGGRHKLPAGLDWRGRNGYIVAAPSVHESGKAYEWAVKPGAVAIPAAPSWLVTMLDPPRPPRPIAQPVKRGRGYGEAALAGEVEAVRMAVEGTRNDTLYEAALKIGSLVAAGLLEAHRAVGAIVDAGLACGLGETEVVGTVRSGFTAGMANPREVAS